ncbi:MAG: prepilin peptidase [Streptococcaceae bacterium]|jgi:leader peptidase (prepilin peptidase)/N-methyltransferase|nr:prepilin peptidase [Streptococcaceae bacterium]
MTEIIIFFTGISFGSFFGLVIDRIPSGDSIVFGSSHCQSCRHSLSALDLIPILSQLLSKSRCRYCGATIPYWYAGLEFSFGLVFLAAWSGTVTLSMSIFLMMCLVLSILDWIYHEFPFVIWIFFTLPIFLISPFKLTSFIWLILAILAEHRDLKIGSGDFLWLYSASLFTDFLSLVILVQIASISGIVHFLLKKEKTEIPFIPHLTAASLILWAVHQIP